MREFGADWVTIDQLVAKTGRPHANIWVALNGMVDRGRVVRAGDGKALRNQAFYRLYA